MNQGASFLVQQQELVEADKGSDVKIETKSCKKSLSKNAIWLKKYSQSKKLMTGASWKYVLPFSSLVQDQRSSDRAALLLGEEISEPKS